MPPTRSTPRVARQALELERLQNLLADANRRAEAQSRRTAELHARLAADDNAAAAYPALLRKVERYRAELLRVGGLLGRAAGHVRGDADLSRAITAALSAANAVTAEPSPDAPAKGAP